MKFTPLPHANWIANATIPVSDHFRISVSYNISPGLWYVGRYGLFECAIQAINPGHEYASLVELKDNPEINIYSHCDNEKIEELKEIASKLEYGGEIEVFAELTRGCGRIWGHRFYCAKGYDMEQKIKYVSRVYSKDGDSWRTILPPETINHNHASKEKSEGGGEKIRPSQKDCG